jgi:hypothetical protein
VLLPYRRVVCDRVPWTKKHAMSEKVIPEITVVGIDIGKTSFHVIGLDRRGAVELRQRLSERLACWGSE